MKHLLTWSPVILPGETVHYSVEYQGEYESLYISWIWIPTSWCTVIEEPKCDVTDDITATVPYKLRVRATLGSQTSAWSTLKHPFNRNSTILTPPRMEVSKDGFHLVIELEDLGPQFEFLVAYWRREPGAKEQTKVVRSRGVPVHLETMDPGATYCVKAQSLVKVIGRHSAFNQAECVEVQSKEDLPVPWAPAEVTAPLGACSGAFDSDRFHRPGWISAKSKLRNTLFSVTTSQFWGLAGCLPLAAVPEEALPLALALFAFLGFMLILVIVPFSIWKMGQLLQYSCCPVVVLPDTLVNKLPLSLQHDADQRAVP
ncbi:interleukin-20 receptor subunit beta-like [Ictidomys tridecemlineatus]